MVEGSIKCMENVDSLKQRFYEGYYISLQAKHNIKQNTLDTMVRGMCSLVEDVPSKNGWLEYKIRGSLDQILELLDCIQPLVRGFNISQTKLDNIFLQITKTGDITDAQFEDFIQKRWKSFE